MTRQEFLNRLEEALQGEVSTQVLQANLRYYRDYISNEIASGRSEADVMEQLGDPRLIARTIVDAQEAGESGGGRYYETASNRGYGYTGGYSEEEYSEMSNRAFPGSWKATLITAAVIVVVLIVFSTIFSLTLQILLSPLFWGVLAAWLIWRLIAGR